MKYGKVWISMTSDCDENLGGYYCQIYNDKEMENQIDDFCIHTNDCDCSNQEEVEIFIREYTKQYQ